MLSDYGITEIKRTNEKFDFLRKKHIFISVKLILFIFINGKTYMHTLFFP
jgi:hypothetical protein